MAEESNLEPMVTNLTEVDNSKSKVELDTATKTKLNDDRKLNSEAQDENKEEEEKENEKDEDHGKGDDDEEEEEGDRESGDLDTLSPLTSPENIEPSNTYTKKSYATPSDTKLYIKNLPFTTVDEELQDFLKDYNPISIFIPTLSVRVFKSLRNKPLGHAYVEFKTASDMTRALVDLEDTKFQNRKLVIKRYYSYQPRRVYKSTPTVEQTESVIEQPQESANTSASPSLILSHPCPHIESNNTLFIPRIPYKATLDDLKEYFEGFTVTEVYLFQHVLTDRRTRSLTYNSKTRSALITFENLPEETGLQQIMETFRNKKFYNRYMVLRRAYLDKIEDVKQGANKKFKVESYTNKKTEEIKSVVSRDSKITIDVISQEKSVQEVDLQ